MSIEKVRVLHRFPGMPMLTFHVKEILRKSAEKLKSPRTLSLVPEGPTGSLNSAIDRKAWQAYARDVVTVEDFARARATAQMGRFVIGEKPGGVVVRRFHFQYFGVDEKGETGTRVAKIPWNTSEHKAFWDNLRIIGEHILAFSCGVFRELLPFLDWIRISWKLDAFFSAFSMREIDKD